MYCGEIVGLLRTRFLFVKNLFNVSFQQLENDLRLDESSAVWHKSNKSNLATAFVQPLSRFFGVRLLCKRPKKEIGQLGILVTRGEIWREKLK